MLKYIFIVIALFAVTSHSIAQKTKDEKISGVVKTTDGELAIYISVSLKGTTYGSVTNENGYFEFEAPVGDYTLVIYSILAHRKEYPITIKAQADNHFPDLEIIENKNQLEEIVVTGQISPQSLRNSVYKVRVINEEQIQLKAATSVQSLLNTEIGIRISNDMALGETDFEIMGMSGNNVKVLINGIPVVDRMDKKQSLNQIDINTIERIEIVEGPMSVAYGTDALAGVINIITKKGKANDGTHLSIGAKIQEETLGDEYNFLSKKGQHVQSVNAHYAFDNGLYASASLSHNEFGGWQGDLPGRKKEWPSKEQYLIGSQIGYTKNDYALSYRFDYMDENTLKKGDIPLNRKALDEEFLADRYTHQLQGHWQANNRLRFALATSYQNYQRNKKSTITNFSTGDKTLSTAEGAQDETEYSSWFGSFITTWKILHNLSIQPGVEFQQNEGSGDKVDEGNNSIKNTAIFLSAEYSPTEWFDIRPGVRSSFNSEYDAPLAIPSLNLKFKLHSDMDFRLSYARGFRAPTLQELYYTFYHTNGGGFWIKGNPDLKAEKSDSYMGSYVWRSLHNENIRLTTTLSGFYNNFKDRIQMVKSASAQSSQTYYNTGKYRTMGLTFENSLVWRALKASLNVSYIGRYNTLYDNEDYSSEKQDKMRYSPELSANVTYDWNKIATFNLFYKFTGKRHEYTEYESQLVLGGLESYNWADLTISRPICKHLSASTGVRNIFDVTTVKNTIDNGSGKDATTSTNLIGSGRSYFVGLSFNFNK